MLAAGRATLAAPPEVTVNPEGWRGQRASRSPHPHRIAGAPYAGVDSSPMTSLSPSLASIRNELDATTTRLHALVDTMDDAAWRTRPGNGAWSVAECIEHLNLTSRAYVHILRDAIQDGRARGLTDNAGRNRLDIVGWMFIKLLEPPVKRMRVTTTPPFVPPSVAPRPNVVAEYDELQQKLIALMTEADGLALSKIKVASPFNAKFRYNMYSAYRMIAVHQRRHLWQAEQAREAMRAVSR